AALPRCLPPHSAAGPEAPMLAEKERSSVALDRGRGIVTLKIRPAAAGDHEDIAALLRTPGSARTDFGKCEDAVADVLSIVRERAAASGVLLVTKGDRPLGVAVFEPAAPQLEIRCLAVTPDADIRLIAALLNDRLVESARVAGLEHVRLKAVPSAVPLFGSLGFRATGDGDGATMRLCTGIDVTPVERLDLTLAPDHWPFELANAPAIEDHWRQLSAANTQLWNGRVLKLIDWRHEGAAIRGRLVESSYAACLAWRDWGYPDPTAKNLFGSAVIRSCDDALIYGRMANHTS